MFPENKTGKCFSTFHHQEIPRRNSICIMTAWSFLRSEIVYLFSQENTSRKFLNLLLFYLPVFCLQISYGFAIMSRPFLRARASWYAALSRVSLRGVGLRCVGLAQKISAQRKRARNTGSHIFSFFFICTFILFLASSYMYVFVFPQIWK